jgi:hypothetical protein
MAFVYKSINPAVSGGGGGGSSDPYVSSFNAGLSWGSASGGVYSIQVLEATHEKGQHPIVQVFELSGGIYEAVTPNSIDVDSSGNVTITTTENLDARFQGKIVIL